MRKKPVCGAVILLMLLAITSSNAQTNNGTNLDILKAPNSPGSMLLGFATADIERPSDISDLMLSLQSNTSSFSKLPSSYAVDIAPFWLFRQKTDFSADGLSSTKFKDYFKQTFLISIAFRNPDSAFQNFLPSNSYTGFGFKFSLLRPGYTTDDSLALVRIHQIQGKINKDIDEMIKEDGAQAVLVTRLNIAVQKLRSAYPDPVEFAKILATQETDTTSEIGKLSAEIAIRNQEIIDKVRSNDETESHLRKAVRSFGAKRTGFSLDLAGGTSLEFRNKRFDNSKFYNAGIWTTFGFLGQHSDILAIGRFMYNPDQSFVKDNPTVQKDDIFTFDAGMRYIISANQSKFTASIEIIYRSILSEGTIPSSWRGVFNADYALFNNQKLSLSLGRNFDGTITKDGNLIAALTFLQGFGNKR